MSAIHDNIWKYKHAIYFITLIQIIEKCNYTSIFAKKKSECAFHIST